MGNCPPGGMFSWEAKMARAIAIYGFIQLQEKHTQEYVRDYVKTKLIADDQASVCDHVQWRDQMDCPERACGYAREARKAFEAGIRDPETGKLYECETSRSANHRLDKLTQEDYAFLVSMGVPLVALVAKACEADQERLAEAAKANQAEKACQGAKTFLEACQAACNVPALAYLLNPSEATSQALQAASEVVKAAEAKLRRLEKAAEKAREVAAETKQMAKTWLAQAVDALLASGYDLPRAAPERKTKRPPSTSKPHPPATRQTSMHEPPASRPLPPSPPQEGEKKGGPQKGKSGHPSLLSLLSLLSPSPWTSLCSSSFPPSFSPSFLPSIYLPLLPSPFPSFSLGSPLKEKPTVNESLTQLRANLRENPNRLMDLYRPGMAQLTGNTYIILALPEECLTVGSGSQEHLNLPIYGAKDTGGITLAWIQRNRYRFRDPLPGMTFFNITDPATFIALLRQHRIRPPATLYGLILMIAGRAYNNGRDVFITELDLKRIKKITWDVSKPPRLYVTCFRMWTDMTDQEIESTWTAIPSLATKQAYLENAKAWEANALAAYTNYHEVVVLEMEMNELEEGIRRLEEEKKQAEEGGQRDTNWTHESYASLSDKEKRLERKSQRVQQLRGTNNFSEAQCQLLRICRNKEYFLEFKRQKHLMSLIVTAELHAVMEQLEVGTGEQNRRVHAIRNNILNALETAALRAAFAKYGCAGYGTSVDTCPFAFSNLVGYKEHVTRVLSTKEHVLTNLTRLYLKTRRMITGEDAKTVKQTYHPITQETITNWVCDSAEEVRKMTPLLHAFAEMDHEDPELKEEDVTNADRDIVWLEYIKCLPRCPPCHFMHTRQHNTESRKQARTYFMPDVPGQRWLSVIKGFGLLFSHGCQFAHHLTMPWAPAVAMQCNGAYSEDPIELVSVAERSCNTRNLADRNLNGEQAYMQQIYLLARGLAHVSCVYCHKVRTICEDALIAEAGFQVEGIVHGFPTLLKYKAIARTPWGQTLIKQIQADMRGEGQSFQEIWRRQRPPTFPITPILPLPTPPQSDLVSAIIRTRNLDGLMRWTKDGTSSSSSSSSSALISSSILEGQSTRGSGETLHPLCEEEEGWEEWETGEERKVGWKTWDELEEEEEHKKGPLKVKLPLVRRYPFSESTSFPPAKVPRTFRYHLVNPSLDEL